MKKVKIALIIAVITGIIIFVIRSIESSKSVEKIPLAENPFTRRISQEIDSLYKLPDCKFSKGFYSDILYHINDNFNEKKLGKTSLENEQQKENLSKTLYAKYADKFIRQAFCVFQGTDWRTEDLNFIRSECQMLKSSVLLENDSPVDKKFNQIQDVLHKYDVVANYIASCKSFSFLQTSLDVHFPVADVEDKIAQASSYLSSRLGNAFVNNCTRLHNDLNMIPHWLFNAHISYLENKISAWSGKYADHQFDFKNQKQYADELHTPLKNEINELNNSTYKVANFNEEQNRLFNKWKAEGSAAYKYF